MIRFFLILFFLWVGASDLRAQVLSAIDTIFFSGVVLDSGTTEPLSGEIGRAHV